MRNLSNSELATAFQVFASAEMDLLQTALQREGEINREARDARKAAEQLFDLQALVLRESANRAAMAQLADMRAAAPNDASLAEGAVRVPRAATEQYGSAGGQEVPLDAHDRDLSAQSLGVLIETAASSATERERSAGGMAESLQRRSFDDVTVKQIGDVMRSKELTINMPLDTFLEKSSILDYPGQPIDTLWSLKERQIEPKCAGYQQKRDVVELVHFPELKHAQSKGRTRPVYGAVNFQESVYGAANALYGHVTIVLKPEVARRATFTVNDSFHTVALTVDRKRRENFFALFGGEAGIPHELKVAVADPESPERKALEEWFDRMEQSCREGRRSSHELAVEGYIPKIVRDQCDENLGEDQAIIALVLKCFADPSATRKTIATHDNIESLLPHLGQANSGALAQAAKDRAAGRDAKLYLVGTAYLEAQIHGPVVPERDIAEIRINLAGDPLHELTPTQQQAARDRLEALSQQTGIRIVYVNTWTIDDTLATNDLSDKTKAINAAHHDNVAIDRRRDEYLADFEAKVAGMVKKIRLEGLPEGMDFVLRGKVLDRIRDAFLRKLQEYRTRDSWQEDSASMVEDALDYVLRPIADEKLGLLKAAAKLEYENPQQKQAFVDMLLQAGGRITNAQVPLVHRQATAQAALLRTWAAAARARGSHIGPDEYNNATELFLKVAVLSKPGLDRRIAAFLQQAAARGDNFYDVTRPEAAAMAFLSFQSAPGGEEPLVAKLGKPTLPPLHTQALVQAVREEGFEGYTAEEAIALFGPSQPAGKKLAENLAIDHAPVPPPSMFKIHARAALRAAKDAILAVQNAERAFLEGPGAARALAAGYHRVELKGLARGFAFYKLATGATDEDAIQAILDPFSKPRRLMAHGGRFTASLDNFRAGLALLDTFHQWFAAKTAAIAEWNEVRNRPIPPDADLTVINADRHYCKADAAKTYEKFVFEQLAIDDTLPLSADNPDDIFSMEKNPVMRFVGRGFTNGVTNTFAQVPPAKRATIFAVYDLLSPLASTREQLRANTHTGFPTLLARILVHLDEIERMRAADTLTKESFCDLCFSDIPGAAEMDFNRLADAISDRVSSRDFIRGQLGGNANAMATIGLTLQVSGCTIGEALAAYRENRQLPPAPYSAAGNGSIEALDGTPNGARQQAVLDLQRPDPPGYFKSVQGLLDTRQNVFTAVFPDNTVLRSASTGDAVAITKKVADLCGSVHPAQQASVFNALTQAGATPIVGVFAEQGIHTSEHMPLTYTLSQDADTGDITVRYSEPTGFPGKFHWTTTIHLDGTTSTTPLVVDQLPPARP